MHVPFSKIKPFTQLRQFVEELHVRHGNWHDRHSPMKEYVPFGQTFTQIPLSIIKPLVHPWQCVELTQSLQPGGHASHRLRKRNVPLGQPVVHVPLNKTGVDDCVSQEVHWSYCGPRHVRQL